MSFPVFGGGAALTLPLSLVNGGTGGTTLPTARTGLGFNGGIIGPQTISSNSATAVLGISQSLAIGEEWLFEIRLSLTAPAAGSKVLIEQAGGGVLSYITGAIISCQAAAIKTTIISAANSLSGVCTGTAAAEQLIIQFQVKAASGTNAIGLQMASTTNTQNTVIAEGSSWTATRIS